jgi:hypothetical protein
MIEPGTVISYIQMCQEEGVNLQRGMNFRLHDNVSVILMSRRSGAPYADSIVEDGRVLIYEGHDEPRSFATPDPKTLDQLSAYPSGALTQNGLFYQAAMKFRDHGGAAELVKVYEKIHAGIWVYNGVFRLVDAWQQVSGVRSVFKFRLELLDEDYTFQMKPAGDIDHNRLIPSSVKLEVWRRDKGRCVQCGSQDNLHFDHIIPYSKGGSSLVAENIQLLCARHNLAKSDKIV